MSNKRGHTTCAVWKWNVNNAPFDEATRRQIIDFYLFLKFGTENYIRALFINGVLK